MTMTVTGDGVRVLLLATDAHGGFGGIAQYNQDVIEAMAGLDRVREVIVLPRTKQEGRLALPAKISYDLGGTPGIRSYLWRGFQHAVGRARPDLVYCAHINLLPVARAIGAARRAPVVLAIYGIDAWSRPEGFGFRMLAPVADLVISISRVTLDRFEGWSGKGHTPTVVLPNAIHACDFGPGSADNPLARRLGIAGRKAILTFGRMSADERYKGFDEVMEVLPRLTARVPGIVYVAAGDGSDRPRLEAKARALGVTDHVLFTGRVPDGDKADLYRLADAYVMPSSGEGFGFVVLEALACGVPVVASSVDGTREALRGGELGLVVDPKDAGALERAIIEALGKPKLVPPGLDYFSFANFQKRLHDALARVVPV